MADKTIAYNLESVQFLSAIASKFNLDPKKKAPE